MRKRARHRKAAVAAPPTALELVIGEATDRLQEAIKASIGLELAVRGEAALGDFDPAPVTELIELHRLKLENIKGGLEAALEQGVQS